MAATLVTDPDGVTTITVTVTTDAGDATNVYTIKVTRGPASADATLNVLGLQGGGDPRSTSPSNTYSYSLTVPAKIGTATSHGDAEPDGPAQASCGG